jgi:hypothetical protein
MIPTVVRLKIKKEKKKGWSLWIPLPLLYLTALIVIILLSPILIVTAIILTIVKGAWIIRATYALIILVSSFCGLNFDISSKDSEISVSIQ